MNKLYYLFACLALFSCAKSQELQVHAQTQVPDLEEQEPRVETETQAVKLAKRHLALKNRDWGNIAKVQEEDSYYRIAFETPVQEKRLIDQRILLVNKDSGLVSVVQRR